MKLKTKYPYTTPRERERFAQFLKNIIDPSNDEPPYMPNGNQADHSFWRVDVTGNNWTLTFNEDSTFYITYRYSRGNPNYEKGLFTWLKIKMHDLELIEE